MAITTTGLVSEWVAKLAKNGTAPGNNTDPTGTWDDLMGLNDGTLTGFVYGTTNGWEGAGTSGDPYCLKGTGAAPYEYVNCGTGASTNLSTVSMEAWVATTNTNNMVLMGKSHTASYYMSTYVSTTSRVAFWTSNTSIEGALADASMHNGNFHHVVVTYGAGSSCIYVDGTKIAGPTARTAPGDSSAIALHLCHAPSNDTEFIGKIATARLYNIALSQAQVTANYDAGVLASSIDATAWPGLTVTRLLQG